MSKVGRSIVNHLERQGWDVEQDTEEEILSFAWQGENQEFNTIVSVSLFGEPALYAVMIRTMLPAEPKKAQITKLLDLMNRINVAFPYGNFVMDTITETWAIMSETQLYLPSDSLQSALFEQVLDTSMEMAEFYLPAFDAVITKNASVDQALDLVINDETMAMLDELTERLDDSAKHPKR
ncbi:MAG: YbjN domain-containing protein [Dehalococcoidia bacterium]